LLFYLDGEAVMSRNLHYISEKEIEMRR